MGKRKKDKPAFKRIRKTWAINPKTRVKKSKKIYSRKKLKTTEVENGEC